jgi:hypothetical protein
VNLVLELLLGSTLPCRRTHLPLACTGRLPLMLFLCRRSSRRGQCTSRSDTMFYSCVEPSRLEQRQLTIVTIIGFTVDFADSARLSIASKLGISFIQAV